MLASVSTCPAFMMPLNTTTLQQPSSSPRKRPRLSLQIKPSATPQTLGKSTTALKADIDPSSPTAFNTLSNAYAVAIENASPRAARPLLTSLDATRSSKPTLLRLETRNLSAGDGEYAHPSQRTQTPGPFSITYPDTPSSAYPSLTSSASTPTSLQPELQLVTEPKQPEDSSIFTPPHSAGSSSEHSMPPIFIFAVPATTDTSTSSSSTPRTPRRRMSITSGIQIAPYTHPRSLHSILRNSPLPPRCTLTPATPSRVSTRLANRAAKKVGYNDPLTQTITTNKYVKSHIDLLSEDSPYSADAELGAGLGPGGNPEGLDSTMADTGAETRDGGQTPGPFEEMRRRMADSDLETPGARKRRRREKKRKWEWTISSSIEGEDGPAEEAHGVGKGGDTPLGRTPITAVMLARTPLTAIRSDVSSVSEDEEVEEGGAVGYHGPANLVPEAQPERMSSEDESDGRPSTPQSL